ASSHPRSQRTRRAEGGCYSRSGPAAGRRLTTRRGLLPFLRRTPWVRGECAGGLRWSRAGGGVLFAAEHRSLCLAARWSASARGSLEALTAPVARAPSATRPDSADQSRTRYRRPRASVVAHRHDSRSIQATQASRAATC